MIHPYKMGSASAKLLAQALDMKQIKHEGSKFKGNKDKIVINWGASKLPEEVMKTTIINRAASVCLAGDKLEFFKAAKGLVSIPEFTTDQEVAKSWYDEGKIVLARTTLKGHSGEGIHIVDPSVGYSWEDQLKGHPDVKVYVKYIPKKDEYRVHVVNGEVIDIRRKALSSAFNKENANWKIRNHAGGFIFAKHGVDAPEMVKEESIKAVDLCGLDFGAVDVIWNNFHKKAYVLEINTAPGLEGSTVDSYKEALAKMFNTDLEDSRAAQTVRYEKLLKGAKGIEATVDFGETFDIETLDIT